MIKVLIVDDYPLICQGIKSLLLTHPLIEVVGTAFNGREAIDFLDKNSETDIVLMGLHMPNLDGIAATRIITSDYTRIKVIMLTIDNNESAVRKSINAGASGCLSKSTTLDNLILGIINVNEGNYFICPTVTKTMFNTYLSEPSEKRVNNPKEEIFSKKEVQILRLICEGNTSKEIGDIVRSSPRTIDIHRHNLLEKSNTTNTAQLIIFAIKNGIYKIK